MYPYYKVFCKNCLYYRMDYEGVEHCYSPANKYIKVTYLEKKLMHKHPRELNCHNNCNLYVHYNGKKDRKWFRKIRREFNASI